MGFNAVCSYIFIGIWLFFTGHGKVRNLWYLEICLMVMHVHSLFSEIYGT